MNKNIYKVQETLTELIERRNLFLDMYDSAVSINPASNNITSFDAGITAENEREQLYISINTEELYVKLYPDIIKRIKEIIDGLNIEIDNIICKLNNIIIESQYKRDKKE